MFCKNSLGCGWEFSKEKPLVKIVYFYSRNNVWKFDKIQLYVHSNFCDKYISIVRKVIEIPMPADLTIRIPNLIGLNFFNNVDFP